MNALLLAVVLMSQCPNGQCAQPSVAVWQPAAVADGGWTVYTSRGYRTIYRSATHSYSDGLGNVYVGWSDWKPAQEPTPAMVKPVSAEAVVPAPPPPVPKDEPPPREAAKVETPQPNAGPMVVELGPASAAIIEKIATNTTPRQDPEPDPEPEPQPEPAPVDPAGLLALPPWVWIIAAVGFFFWLYGKYKDTVVAWLKKNAGVIVLALAAGGYAYHVGWIPPVSEWTIPDWVPRPTPSPEPVEFIKPHVIGVYESKDLTAEQARVFLSAKVDAYLAQRGSPPMRRIDDDQTQAEAKELIASVRAKVPSGIGIQVRSSSKRIYWTGPMPKTEADFLKRVKQFGG